MAALRPHLALPSGTTTATSSQPDEWEDWDTDGDDLNPAKPASHYSPYSHRRNISNTSNGSYQEDGTASRTPQHRYSVQRPSRIKSRGRQKAQNAKAGIKLVTDMSKFKRPAVPGPKSAIASAREDKKGKFSDAAALLALEGEPTSASIGSFSWMKKKQGYSRFNKGVKKHGRGPSADLSPAERPIVIGISVPEDNLSSHQVSPWTAVLETPANDFSTSQSQAHHLQSNPHSSPQQLRSVWSPDTEASSSPQSALQSKSSIYSPASRHNMASAPPMPALPATHQFKQTVAIKNNEEDDLDTPCTLFEEDGSPLATRKSLKPPAVTLSPESAVSRSQGWWDHVTTPFSAISSPFSKQQSPNVASSATHSDNEWWKGSDEKTASSEPAGQRNVPASSTTQPPPSEKVTSNIAGTIDSGQSSTQSGKTEIFPETTTAAELPPPYSPPKEQVKYGVVLPPSQVFAQPVRVPSPRPLTPNLPGTMTSQGSPRMADVPLTPATRGNTTLPDRAPGSYATGDHFLEARGVGNRTERQRRRHEKEDVVARKVGGFWRGRGCMPENGCMGRSGREGRKRRRVCLSIIGGVLALIILAIILAVVLSRKAVMGQPGGEKDAQPQQPAQPEQSASAFLNVTNFPPMPTGVLTMEGPDNTVAFSDCMHQGTPKTSWSCSLPKEEHESVSPFKPNQPEFIFQIQYDNHTFASWNVPNGADPVFKGFSPSPDPPKFKDMNFLGNTTDGIVSAAKAGEPTPFYISLLTSVNATVGADVLSRRQGFNNGIGGSGGDNGSTSNFADQLPRPILQADGTIAPAQLFPRPVQQPVRLFDRGLPSEHYGFYTYFNKTIFIHDKSNISAIDEDGGAPREDASVIMVFSQARFLVQIWTRKESNAQLLGNGSAPEKMPYPVTVTEDMHGGNPSLKADYYWALTADKHANTTDGKLIIADRKFGGTIINAMATRDPQLGGIDGGTGGCKCQWKNFRESSKP